MINKKHKIAIINGPNLNRLGQRDTKVYGSAALPEINAELKEAFGSADLTFFQSNIEGEIVDFVQQAADCCDALIINGGAYSHYSYAIADALETVKAPVIEVHLSNIYAREEFRHTSVISPKVKGVICGFGADSYRLAVIECLRLLGDGK